MAADGLFAGKTKPSVGYTARFVPLEGDISQTVSIFVAERFFLKKTGDSGSAYRNILGHIVRHGRLYRLLIGISCEGP